MELTKPEGRLGGADRDWDETLGIPSFGGFVLDPRGVDGGARPENNNGLCVLERLLDLLVKT
jgi:hypothetical protein